MRVIDLIPGMKIEGNTFMAQVRHPLYLGFQLVVWRLTDGELSLDALSPIQEVGEPQPFNKTELADNLRKAFHP